MRVLAVVVISDPGIPAIESLRLCDDSVGCAPLFLLVEAPGSVLKGIIINLKLNQLLPHSKHTGTESKIKRYRRLN